MIIITQSTTDVDQHPSFRRIHRRRVVDEIAFWLWRFKSKRSQVLEQFDSIHESFIYYRNLFKYSAIFESNATIFVLVWFGVPAW